MTGDGVRVVVVDSGVNSANPHVSSVAGGTGIDSAGRPVPGFVDTIGHGTAVFAAIQEKAPNASIYAVRVFDAALASTAQALVAAIDWAAANAASLVNLSLGTANPKHAGALADAVQRLANAGGVVVAAAEADGQPRWPGALPNVLGVVGAQDCPRGCVEVRVAAIPQAPNLNCLRTDVEVRPQTAALLLGASPYPRPIAGVPMERNLSGVSFAVANATGVAARALQGHEGPLAAQDILAKLEAVAI